MDNSIEHSSTFDFEIRLYGGYPLYEKRGQTYMAIMEDAYIHIEKLDQTQPQFKLCFQRLYEDLNQNEDLENPSVENQIVKKQKTGRRKNKKTHWSNSKYSRKTKSIPSRPTLSKNPSDKIDFSVHEEPDYEYTKPDIFNDDTTNIINEENHTDSEKVIYYHHYFLIMSQIITFSP